MSKHRLSVPFSEQCGTCLYEEVPLGEEPCDKCVGARFADDPNHAWKPQDSDNPTDSKENQ
jgi:hypothetical protein